MMKKEKWRIVEKDSEKEIKKAGMRVKADCDALVLLPPNQFHGS